MHGPQQPSLFPGDRYWVNWVTSPILSGYSLESIGSCAEENRPSCTPDRFSSLASTGWSSMWSERSMLQLVDTKFLHTAAAFWHQAEKSHYKTEANAKTKRNAKQILGWSGSFSTNAGNLFKCCRASTKYRVAISDWLAIKTLFLYLLLVGIHGNQYKSQFCGRMNAGCCFADWWFGYLWRFKNEKSEGNWN